MCFVHISGNIRPDGIQAVNIQSLLREKIAFLSGKCFLIWNAHNQFLGPHCQQTEVSVRQTEIGHMLCSKLVLVLPVFIDSELIPECRLLDAFLTTFDSKEMNICGKKCNLWARTIFV